MEDDNKRVWRAVTARVDAYRPRKKTLSSPPSPTSDAASQHSDSDTPASWTQPHQSPFLPDHQAVRVDDLHRLNRSDARQLVRGAQRPQAILDLHGLNREQALAAVQRFILASVRQQHRQVLIVTGKGSAQRPSILRQELPRFLETPPLRPHILALATAPLHLGGAGACLVRLKRLNR